MSTIKVFLVVILSVLLFSHLISCKKEHIKIIPTVSALAVTNITSNSATAGGTVTADGGDQVTARGVCWSPTNSTPTTADSKTSDFSGLGSFASALSGLTPGTTYNLTAYATNAIGTAYSSASSFKTLALAPTLTTTDFSAVTSNSLNSGGIVTNDGGSPVTARGICWSPNLNPTVSDNKTTDGSGTGSFTSSITGLNPGTTYYFRAYATNSISTAYGNQLTTKTSFILPTLTTIPITSITATGAFSGGDIKSDGGSPVIARGVCWSTNQNPTIADNYTVNGTGTAGYPSELNLLDPVHTYFVRAYATNSMGTSYGNQVSFTTPEYPNCGTVTDIDGNVYQTVTIGAQCWLRENLKTTKYRDGTAIPLVADSLAWSNLSTPGYCWYNNDAAANKNTYGALYNWYVVSTGKLCPTGWHVPDRSDCDILSSYLGDKIGDGGALKEKGLSHWLSPNLGATNVTGFTALPGGRRDYWGTFLYLGYYCNWWSSKEYSPSMAGFRLLTRFTSNEFGDYYDKRHAFSVRCLKD